MRCLMLTSFPREEVARVLTDLMHPFAFVTPSDSWMPGGFANPAEGKLGDTAGFLGEDQREELMQWWLQVRPHANVPNWDLVSTCVTSENTRGLLLVEAKAHEHELGTGGKTLPATPNGFRNHERIGAAVLEANTALNAVMPGWSLTRDSHYQLCNRFAWARKLGNIGMPVFLVYLGFLGALEMGPRYFKTGEQWRQALLAHSASVVPPETWGQQIIVGSVPLTALIRSARVSWQVADPTAGLA